jgi:hypothetical protein
MERIAITEGSPTSLRDDKRKHNRIQSLEARQKKFKIARHFQSGIGGPRVTWRPPA